MLVAGIGRHREAGAAGRAPSCSCGLLGPRRYASLRQLPVIGAERQVTLRPRAERVAVSVRKASWLIAPHAQDCDAKNIRLLETNPLPNLELSGVARLAPSNVCARQNSRTELF